MAMKLSRHFLLFVMLLAGGTAAAMAQTAPTVGHDSSAMRKSASIPNLSGVWSHPALPWFEPPASGPGPVTNKSRGPQRPSGLSGSPGSPPLAQGVSNYDQLVGDWTNPILQPW